MWVGFDLETFEEEEVVVVLEALGVLVRVVGVWAKIVLLVLLIKSATISCMSFIPTSPL